MYTCEDSRKQLLPAALENHLLRAHSPSHSLSHPFTTLAPPLLQTICREKKATHDAFATRHEIHLTVLIHILYNVNLVEPISFILLNFEQSTDGVTIPKLHMVRSFLLHSNQWDWGWLHTCYWTVVSVTTRNITFWLINMFTIGCLSVSALTKVDQIRGVFISR